MTLIFQSQGETKMDPFPQHETKNTFTKNWLYEMAEQKGWLDKVPINLAVANAQVITWV